MLNQPSVELGKSQQKLGLNGQFKGTPLQCQPAPPGNKALLRGGEPVFVDPDLALKGVIIWDHFWLRICQYSLNNHGEGGIGGVCFIQAR